MTAQAGGQRTIPESGMLIVDKPRGVTSHDVVAASRRLLHTKKVGHAGTLDPMATGVLVLGFGDATRLLNHIVEHDKTYEATIRLGQATTTDDADGEFIDVPDDTADTSEATADADSTAIAKFRSRWQELVSQSTEGGLPAIGTSGASALADTMRSFIEQVIAARFTGHIDQVPNTYSAIKINGQRAYDLARDGRDVELKARRITVSEFTVLGMRVGFASDVNPGEPLTDRAVAPDIQADAAPLDDAAADAGSGTSLRPVIDLDVRVSCSAGTYIRALGRDLGVALGVGGYLTRLRRTRIGRFHVTDPNVVVAHAEPHRFTDRNGIEQTRNRAVFALAANGKNDDAANDEALKTRIIPMLDAAQAAMPTLAITTQDANNLRYGRRIPYDIHGAAAAYLPDTGEVVALVERAKRGETKPVTVFHANG